MATIAEKLAARKKTQPATAATVQSNADNAVLEAVIDRIDPPGKSQRAESARNTARMILKLEQQPTASQPEIRVVTPDRRALGDPTGETIDMTPQNATQAQAAWHAAYNAFETELCLMRDPTDSEVAWLAVRLDGQEDWPILLKSFPLYEHPRMVRTGPF